MKRGSDDLEIICFTSSNCFQAVTFYSTNTQRHIFGIAARFISSLQHLGSVLCVKTHVRNQSAAIRCRSASTVPRQDKAVIFKDLGIRTCVLAWEGGGRGGQKYTYGPMADAQQCPKNSKRKYRLRTETHTSSWSEVMIDRDSVMIYIILHILFFQGKIMHSLSQHSQSYLYLNQ